MAVSNISAAHVLTDLKEELTCNVSNRDNLERDHFVLMGKGVLLLINIKSFSD